MPSDITALYLFETDKELKQHPSYVAAKAGDVGSALRLVSDLALATIYGATARFTKEDIFVAPHAKEATGDNAIPQVFAEVCALVYQATTDTDIVQSTRVYHTGADPMERLISRPQFEGTVKPGGRYVLVDDVTSLGGTLAELAHYIQANGGLVQDVFVLVNAGRQKALVPNRMVLKKLAARYANDISEIFGVAIGALTCNEAQYLVGFRSADELRNRVLKARQEVHLRLRSKGISSDSAAQT